LTELGIDRTHEILDAVRTKRIMIVGDVMLDRYVWGRVTRVSPEAPVPVVEVDDEAVRLGGAANVAANVAALGADPLLIGLTGENDAAARELNSLLNGYGLSTEGLIEDPDRHTTVKTRILAHHQHVVRADREDTRPADGEAAASLIDAIKSSAGEVDAVILEDYNKGTLSRVVIEKALPLLIETGLPVTVDPKIDRFFDYRGVMVFKPNLNEVETALGVALTDDESVAEAAFLLRRKLEAENVLITRGERGMTLLESDDSVIHVGTMARHVYDVSGAGDTVIATLSAALAAGANVREAATLANYAAGVVIAEVGVVPIEPESLAAAVAEGEE
jgi:rfaE bifunctional protein kinase chain/domain